MKGNIVARPRNRLGRTLLGLLVCTMLVLTAWSMVYNCRAFLVGTDFVKQQPHLFIIGVLISALEVWMVVEVILHIRRKRAEAAPAA